MRWLVEVAIGAMLDERARRAVEETLLDWAHESRLTRDFALGSASFGA